MKTFTPMPPILFVFLLSAAFALWACQRIDVDEREYDTVEPYLPQIAPDPEVVGVLSEREADADAEDAEKTAIEVRRDKDDAVRPAVNGTGLRDGLSEKVRGEAARIKLQITPEKSADGDHATQR